MLLGRPRDVVQGNDRENEHGIRAFTDGYRRHGGGRQDEDQGVEDLLQQDGPNRGRFLDGQCVGSVILKPLLRLLLVQAIHYGLKRFVNILFSKGALFFHPAGEHVLLVSQNHLSSSGCLLWLTISQ